MAFSSSHEVIFLRRSEIQLHFQTDYRTTYSRCSIISGMVYAPFMHGRCLRTARLYAISNVPSVLSAHVLLSQFLFFEYAQHSWK